MNTTLSVIADEQDVTGFYYYPYLYNTPFIFPSASGLGAGNRLATGDVSVGAAREVGPQVSGRAAVEGVFQPLLGR